MSAHSALIDRYEKGIGVLETALKNLPPDIVDRRPEPSKWNIREVAVHLADAELVAAARMRWIAAEPGSPIKAFDQDKWAARLGYGAQTPQQALELFRALRHATVAMLRALPDEVWSNTGMHEERGEVSLLNLVEGYAGHAEHHAAQIRKLREKFAA